MQPLQSAYAFDCVFLYPVAPISTNMILNYVAEHILGLPRSY